MAENKIIGYKKIFGFVLPDWVSEKMIKSVIGGLFVGIVMLLVLIFFIWPNFAVIEAKKLELAASKRDLEVLKGSSQGLEKIRTDLTENELEKILSSMPSQYSPDEAIYLLRRISADTGVSIISYSLPPGTLLSTTATLGSGGGSDMVDFVTYPIRITVAAPVESLLAFIAKAESSLPFGVVSDLNLQEVVKLSRSTADKTVQLAMEIKFYQSILRTVNINKLQPMTNENLSLAKELIKYNLLTVPEVTETVNLSSTGTGSGTIFGF